jgi:hypothetical protein
MRKALTDKALDALKPQAKRYEVHDLYCPGLGCVAKLAHPQPD